MALEDSLLDLDRGHGGAVEEDLVGGRRRRRRLYPRASHEQLHAALNINQNHDTKTKKNSERIKNEMKEE